MIVGGDETAGFKTQTRLYADVLEEAGASVETLEAAGLNHFTLLAPLAEPEHLLHAKTQRFIDACLDDRSTTV